MTAELAAIVAASVGEDEILKVCAVAGSGKSTALREYAAARPHTACLYLTFNKPAQADQEAKFAAAGLAHVRVATLDALAYEATRWLHGGCVAPLLLVRTDACAGSGDILDSFACVLEELSKSAC